MTGRRFLYLLTLAVCVVFYIAYQQWFSWLLLLTVLLFPWLSLALSLPAMITLRLSPSAAGRVHPGYETKADLVGTCQFPLTPVKGKLRITRLTTGESWVLKPGAALPTDHCGGLRIEPIRAKTADYLGIFRKKVKKIETSTVLVLPTPLQMPVPPDLSRFLARAWRPKFGGGYAENHELRLYRPGDNLNQVHWKLSAKTGKLILREPMEPQRGLMLLTMDLNGTAAELDRKFGRLLWLGNYLLEQDVPFEVRALTGRGIENWRVKDLSELQKCVDELLCATPAAAGSIRNRAYAASWQHHIGGETDEA